MLACDDMEIGAAPVYFSLILAGRCHPERVYAGHPRYGTPVFFQCTFIMVTHVSPPLHQILAGNSRQDDLCVNSFLIHLRAKRKRIGHQVVDQARVPV